MMLGLNGLIDRGTYTHFSSSLSDHNQSQEPFKVRFTFTGPKTLLTILN